MKRRLHCAAAARLILSLAAVLFPVGLALGQADYKAAFGDYTRTKGYVTALTKALEAAENRNRPECTRRRIERGKDIRVERLFLSKKSRQPTAGYWGELVTIRGCGDALNYRVWFILSAGRPLFAFAAVPGETRADAYQMRSAMKEVFQASKRAVVGCDTVRFRNSKLVAGGDKGAWDEQWFIVACGIPRTIALTFRQSGPDTRKSTVTARITTAR